MPSITEMMSATVREKLLMPFIVATTWLTT